MIYYILFSELKIMSYLTEKHLKVILDSSPYTFVHNKGFPKDKSYRPDFRCDELMLIIEFDGYRHYNNLYTQLRDRNKDMLYEEENYKVVRIPYFIQLTEEVYEQLFVEHGYDLQIDRGLLINDYPHGFHDPKALRPTDFNIYGMSRFMKEMSFTFMKQQYDVFESAADEFTLLYQMGYMYDVVDHVRGYVESGYDVHGMTKAIREKYYK